MSSETSEMTDHGDTEERNLRSGLGLGLSGREPEYQRWMTLLAQSSYTHTRTILKNIKKKNHHRN